MEANKQQFSEIKALRKRITMMRGFLKTGSTGLFFLSVGLTGFFAFLINDLQFQSEERIR